jgi:hypothetical protein
MPRELLHDHPQFADLNRIVAQEKGIDPALIEKDYAKAYAIGSALYYQGRPTFREIMDAIEAYRDKL